MGRKLYRLIEKIPKEIKEDVHYLVNITSKIGIYALTVIGTVIAVSYMFRGCQNQEKHVQNSELEQTLDSR